MPGEGRYKANVIFMRYKISKPIPYYIQSIWGGPNNFGSMQQQYSAHCELRKLHISKHSFCF